MAFFGDMGKKVGEVAQAAAKKSGELVEITKLNVNINSEEDKIQKLYIAIGKLVFENYNGGPTTYDVSAQCEEIKQHEQAIKVLKDKIIDVKGNKICVSCGASMDKAQVFCSKCGAKNEVEQTYAAAQPSAAPMISCPACGMMLAEGTAFCTNCGGKMGS